MPLRGAVRFVAGLVGAIAMLPATTVHATLIFQCPNTPLTCHSTGNFCVVGVEWTVPCGCAAGNFFQVNCVAPQYTGVWCPGGQAGCEVFVTCTATPDLSTICPTGGDPVEASSQPPASPASCPPSTVGRPVSVTTGAMFFTHTDAAVGDIVVSRTFNSARVGYPSRYGGFGPGWNSSIETRLTVTSPRHIEVRSASGDVVYYHDHNLDGTFDAVLPYSAESTVQAVGGGYQRLFRAGGNEAFDSSGRLTSATDASGIATTYTRDGQGRVVSVSRRGRSVSFTYVGSSSRPQQILSSTTVLATYGYDVSDRLESVVYPDGSGYRYAYDSSARIATVTDNAGVMIEAHAYDGSGRATTSEVGDGIEKFTLAYTATQTTVTDALSNVTVYDIVKVRGVPRVKKITGPCASCGGGGGDVQEWAYDASGNITSYTNGAGKTWTYTYNSSNDLLTETDPLTQVTTYTYDSEGRILTRTGPDGSLVTYTHGPSGPLTLTEKVDATTNRTTTITYNSDGKPATITDPRSKTTTLTYDVTTADLTAVTDSLSHVTDFGYDGFGRRTTVTDALSHTTTTTYDVTGRVTRVTAHDGTHTDFEYDLGGRRSTVADPLGRKTYYLYDRHGRLTSVVDAMNGITRYGYDAMSQLTSLTDAKAQTTTFEYDAHGRLKKTIYPGGAFETFTYDSAGRLATKTDRKTVTTTFTYDFLDRLTGKTYSNSEPAVSYTYDAGGRMQTAANGVDTLTWTYDLSGQVLTEASTKNSSTVAYTYDAAGNRLTLSLDGTLFVSYAYDDASRLTSITRGSNAFGFGYDNANRRTSMTYPNGVNTAYTYDNLDRILGIVATKAPSTTIASSVYTYDAAGNRLTKTHPEYAETYGYDPLYRLTTVDRTGIAKRQRYVYDAVGNRLSEQVDDNVTSYSYNNLNQLLSTAGGGTMRWRGTLNEPGNVTFTSATVNGKPARMLAGNTFEADIPVTSGSNTVTLVATDNSSNTTTKNYSVSVSGTAGSMTYDANGNMITNGTKSYEWDAENRLTRVLDSSVEVARFKYDALGRRVEKIANTTTITTWLYDASDILRQADAATIKYIHGPGIDEPLAQEDWAGTLTMAHADVLGSVIKNSTSLGITSGARAYDAWGAFEAGAANGQAFTGREWDSETGLHYYRARYYDSRSGRFMSEDPLRFIVGMNSYVYVNDNPAALRDPRGLAPQEPAFPPPFPSTPTMPGTCPDKKTCSPSEVQAAFQRTYQFLMAMYSGKPPSSIGTGIGASIGTATIRRGEWDVPMLGPPDAFDPWISPKLKDPCVRHCARLHEWVHYTDGRKLNRSWSRESRERYSEYPAYAQELTCLFSFLQ